MSRSHNACIAGRNAVQPALCWRALQRLPSEIQPVDAEMNVGVDEAGRNNAVAQIKDIRAAGPPDRARYFDNAIAFYEDFSRAKHPVAQAVEQFSAQTMTDFAM